jgi:hypothetical protein
LLIYNLLNKYRKYGHRKNRLDRDKTGWIPISNYIDRNIEDYITVVWSNPSISPPPSSTELHYELQKVYLQYITPSISVSSSPSIVI